MYHGVAILIFSFSLWAFSNSFEFFVKSKPHGLGEWGMYNDLPAERALMEELFKLVFKRYIQREDSKTKCSEHDAFFQRWYKSAFHENHFIWSYYCKTEGYQGYEHMHVEIINTEIGNEKINILDFQTKLVHLGIIGARPYKKEDRIDELIETNIEWGISRITMSGWAIKRNLINAVEKQIALQKDPYTDLAVCPNPGGGVEHHDVDIKNENGLNYYRFEISCHNAFPNAIPVFNTFIEVATTPVFIGDNLAIVDGALVSIQYPLRTNKYGIEYYQGFCSNLEAHYVGREEDCRLFCGQYPQSPICLPCKKTVDSILSPYC